MPLIVAWQCNLAWLICDHICYDDGNIPSDTNLQAYPPDTSSYGYGNIYMHDYDLFTRNGRWPIDKLMG